jgi:hypothetical protein
VALDWFPIIADGASERQQMGGRPAGREFFGAIPPSPLFFGTAHSKGLTTGLSVSAESKGLICTKIVQNSGGLGTAHSKRLSQKKQVDNKKAAGCLPLGQSLI